MHNGGRLNKQATWKKKYLKSLKLSRSWLEKILKIDTLESKISSEFHQRSPNSNPDTRWGDETSACLSGILSASLQTRWKHPHPDKNRILGTKRAAENASVRARVELQPSYIYMHM